MGSQRTTTPGKMAMVTKNTPKTFIAWNLGTPGKLENSRTTSLFKVQVPKELAKSVSVYDCSTNDMQKSCLLMCIQL